LVRRLRKSLRSARCPGNIALCLPESLTLIRRLQPRKLVGVLTNQSRQLRENSPPLPGIHVPPFRRLESSSSRINSTLGVLFGRPRNLSNNFPARWINDRRPGACRAVLPISPNEHLHLLKLNGHNVR